MRSSSAQAPRRTPGRTVSQYLAVAMMRSTLEISSFSSLEEVELTRLSDASSTPLIFVFCSMPKRRRGTHSSVPSCPVTCELEKGPSQKPSFASSTVSLYLTAERVLTRFIV